MKKPSHRCWANVVVVFVVVFGTVEWWVSDSPSWSNIKRKRYRTWKIFAFAVAMDFAVSCHVVPPCCCCYVLQLEYLEISPLRWTPSIGRGSRRKNRYARFGKKRAPRFTWHWSKFTLWTLYIHSVLSFHSLYITLYAIRDTWAILIFVVVSPKTWKEKGTSIQFTWHRSKFTLSTFYVIVLFNSFTIHHIVWKPWCSILCRRRPNVTFALFM